MIPLRLLTFAVTLHSIQIALSKTITIPEGKSVIIQCHQHDCMRSSWNFEGKPIAIHQFPDYTYTKNPHGFCDLTINNVKVDRDDGAWQCFKPKDPTIDALMSNITVISVIATPSPPQIFYNNTLLKDGQVVDAAQNQPIRLKCVSERAKPESIINWTVETMSGGVMKLRGNLSRENHNKSKLVRTTNTMVLPNNNTMDNATITCRSGHLYDGNINTISCRLNITYDTTHAYIKKRNLSSLKKNDNVTLVCEANGNPPPYFQWRFKGKNMAKWWIVYNDAIFTFTVSDDRIGTYMCYAGNKRYYVGSTRYIIFDVWSDEQVIEATDHLTALTNVEIAGLVCGLVFVMVMTVVVVMTVKSIQRRRNKSAKENFSTALSYIRPTNIRDKKVNDVEFNSGNKILRRGVHIYVPTNRESSNDTDQEIPTDNVNQKVSTQSSAISPTPQSEDPHGYMLARQLLRSADLQEYDHYVPHDPEQATYESSRDSGVSNIYEDVASPNNDYENAAIRKYV